MSRPSLSDQVLFGHSHRHHNPRQREPFDVASVKPNNDINMTTIFADNWIVGCPVVNRTGLGGRWDGNLEYVPAFVPGPHPDSAPVENPTGDSGPNLLSAIREQLGLRLEPTKAPVTVLVIDHVERPTPD